MQLLETEKRDGPELPVTVLYEPRGLLLFQTVRGGIEFNLGLGSKPWAIDLADPHPRSWVPNDIDDE